MEADGRAGRRARHARAIERSLARPTVEINPSQLSILLTHLQENALFQRQMTTAVAASQLEMSSGAIGRFITFQDEMQRLTGAQPAALVAQP